MTLQRQRWGHFTNLWRQFLPLSLSDVTMAAGDPAITFTLAHLPSATLNLGAVGIAKAISVFFESPIIMLLHASNALAPAAASRRALRSFMILSITILSVALLIVAAPPVFYLVGHKLLGLASPLLETSRAVLALLFLWPAAIGWRRYYQGLLIRSGESRWIARAGLARIAFVIAILWMGYRQQMHGAYLAALALIAGVLVEAAIVTVAAQASGAAKLPELAVAPKLPSDMRGVWRFYWPLANSMLIVWGGRAILLGIVARSVDATMALAAWPAAWGLVLVIANASRMVQQIVIRNKGELSASLLIGFATSVGAALSLLLVAVGSTAAGNAVIAVFVGGDPGLSAAVRPVILVTAAVPLLVSIQNALQGFLISEGLTHRVNVATWIGTTVLLATAYVGVHFNVAGATAAAVAMVLALLFENTCLLVRAHDLELNFFSTTKGTSS